MLITLEEDRSGASFTGGGSTAEERTVDVLKKRLVSILGQEGRIRAYGNGQYGVEIPAEADLKQIEEVLTNNAKLEWYSARSVRTGAGIERLYDIGKQIDYRGAPAFTFLTRTGGREILPGTAEYRKVIQSWGTPVLEGDDLEHIDAAPYGESYIPEMKFTPTGGRKLEAWSRANMNKGPQLAAVLDGVVISIAPLRDGTILKDSAQIQGQFDRAYVMQLKDSLNSGSLPVPLKVVSVEKL